MSHFPWIKRLVRDLSVEITREDPEKGIFLVRHPETGIFACVFTCGEDVLIIEQPVARVPEKKQRSFFRLLLSANMDLPCGAFCLDHERGLVLFRHTHIYPGLDSQHIENSLRSLEYALMTHGPQLAAYMDEV